MKSVLASFALATVLLTSVYAGHAPWPAPPAPSPAAAQDPYTSAEAHRHRCGVPDGWRTPFLRTN
jgi:hypothetical protein